jgi:hypothetical protein
MPVTNKPTVRQIAQDLLTKPSLQRSDVDGLLDRAMEDGKLTTAERKQIRMVIDKFAQVGGASDEAITRLKGFLDIRGDSLRNLAHTLEKNDGVIDASEAKKIADFVKADGKISGNEKMSLAAVMIGAKMTDEARAVLKATLDGGSPGGGAAGLIDLGLAQLDGKKWQLSPEGFLTSGAAVQFDAAGALEMYHGAEALVATAGTPFKNVPDATKTKALAFLEKAFTVGKDNTPLPEVSKQRIRSAAASTLLALIEGSTGALKDGAVAAYLKHAASEPMHGLRASMYFNLDRIKSQLSPAQNAELDTLKKAVVPQKPPYEEWFKQNGSRSINVVHYAHKECWDFGADPISQYRAKGYTVVTDNSSGRPPRWVLEKTNNGAPGGAIKARIEVIQSHDGIFQKMDDPKTNVVLYTGHSNLGGNVSEELRLGPDEKSSKLIMMAMCRGKQNIHEVANKYPNSHFVTTDQPSYFSSVIPMSLGMVEGCLNQRDYAQMKEATPQISDMGGKSNYFYPNEARRYDHYDVDKDGYLDGQGAHTDKLFNITLRPPTVKRTDGVVRANDLDERNINGENVTHAVQFLNTVVTYHVDHHNNTSKLGPGDMDNFVGGGWFEGPASEKVKITKRADGKLAVSVNKGLFDQSWAVLGTIVQFEVTKQMLQERNGGTLTKNDEARAMLFAGEYLAYMYCSQEEAEMGIASIAKDSKFFQGTNFGHLYKAVDADGHGYVTDAQMDALIRLRP